MQLLRLLDLLADVVQPLDGSGSQALHHLQCLKLGPPAECAAAAATDSVATSEQQQQQWDMDDDEGPVGWPDLLFQQLMQRLRGVPLLLQQLQVLELWGLNQQQQIQVRPTTAVGAKHMLLPAVDAIGLHTMLGCSARGLAVCEVRQQAAICKPRACCCARYSCRRCYHCTDSWHTAMQCKDRWQNCPIVCCGGVVAAHHLSVVLAALCCACAGDAAPATASSNPPSSSSSSSSRPC
jgi:hypothetical protein